MHFTQSFPPPMLCPPPTADFISNEKQEAISIYEDSQSKQLVEKSMQESNYSIFEDIQFAKHQEKMHPSSAIKLLHQSTVQY
jgi:hypothetical protein